MLKLKFSLKPNFSACLRIVAFSLPKNGIRKKAIKLNHNVDKKTNKYPNFQEPFIINHIPKPITKNELVILQVKIKKVFKKIEIEPLKKEIITFLNWFSEYNLVPKGMCLKLHLLSGEAVTNYEDENYLAYNKQ